MPKRAVFERSCRELSLDVSVGLHILLVVEQSSLESQSRGCAKTPILTVVLFKKNLNASKPSNQSKGLGGNIGFCRDKNSTWY